MDIDPHAVDDASYINDIREVGVFRGITFSNYKKTEVKCVMVDNLLKGKIEPTCYWCAELVCAGHFMDIWETILHYLGKHIHLGNPRLAVYLEQRYTVFRNIMTQSIFTHELQVRNNANIRKLFAEILCVLCLSPRKHSFEPIKINREEEFDITQMTERLKAPSVHYVEPIFRKDDPKELFIALNEFSYCLATDSPNLMRACYWIEWVIEFDALCKKRKQHCVCERRANPVESKFQRDVIWMCWDALLHYAEARDEFVQKTMHAVFRLFCIKYTTGACKKRRYLLYFAVGLLTEVVPRTTEILAPDNKPVLVGVTSQINSVYREIKKNEESPHTEYLFAGMDKERNAERSMRKLEIMNSVAKSYSGHREYQNDDDDEFKG